MQEYVVQFFIVELYWQVIVRSRDIDMDKKKLLQQYVQSNDFDYLADDFIINVYELDEWLAILRERGKELMTTNADTTTRER